MIQDLEARRAARKELREQSQREANEGELSPAYHDNPDAEETSLTLRDGESEEDRIERVRNKKREAAERRGAGSGSGGDITRPGADRPSQGGVAPGPGKSGRPGSTAPGAPARDKEPKPAEGVEVGTKDDNWAPNA